MRFAKKILSYLVDIQLDKASTPLNPVLDLSLRKGRYYLTTANAVYSFGDLYDNFSKTFKKLDFTKNSISHALVLGFGMGSVPYMLERVFGQKINYTGVEADAKIVEWAARYTLPNLHSEVELLHSNALDFVETCTSKFDLVVVDIFLDDHVPSEFESLAFLANTKKLLADNGLLLFNRLVDTEAALTTTERFFEERFKMVFPKATYLDVDGNWMLANRAAWA